MTGESALNVFVREVDAAAEDDSGSEPRKVACARGDAWFALPGRPETAEADECRSWVGDVAAASVPAVLGVPSLTRR